MKKVWIVEKKIGDVIDSITAVDDEIKGLRQALSEISNEFTDNYVIWDMSDTIIASRAYHIYSKMQSNDRNMLLDAVQLYNAHMNYHSDPIHNWQIYSVGVQEPGDIQQLDRSFFFPNEDEDEEPSEEEIKADVKVAAVSTGATCRKCTTFNEYAVPDTNDCTYLCGQCKTFIKVFTDLN